MEEEGNELPAVAQEVLEPDESIEANESSNEEEETPMVKCEICGKELKHIGYFHLKTHGISVVEYKEKYPSADMGTQHGNFKKSDLKKKTSAPAMVKCEVCGKEMQVVGFFHLRTHGLNVQQYKEKYPNAVMGYPHKPSATKKIHQLTPPPKPVDENVPDEGEENVEVSPKISPGGNAAKDEVADERVTCNVCGEKFFILNNTHLRTHGMTVEQYQKRYPDADMGSTRSSPMKYHNLVDYDNPIKTQKKEFLSLNIVEKGKLDILRPEKAAYVRFRELRTRVGWTVSETLHTLIDFFEKYENDEGTKIAIDQMKYASSGLPKDFIPQHRDKLQNILTILEEKAFEEKDPGKLASLTDKIIKINLALPQLEKSDESLVDLKIKEIVEKRKLVFANSLPEFD